MHEPRDPSLKVVSQVSYFFSSLTWFFVVCSGLWGVLVFAGAKGEEKEEFMHLGGINLGAPLKEPPS